MLLRKLSLVDVDVRSKWQRWFHSWLTVQFYLFYVLNIYEDSYIFLSPIIISSVAIILWCGDSFMGWVYSRATLYSIQKWCYIICYINSIRIGTIPNFQVLVIFMPLPPIQFYLVAVYWYPYSGFLKWDLWWLQSPCV